MIVAKTAGGFKIEKVEKISSLHDFSTSNHRNPKNTNFETILTTVLYPTAGSTEAPIDSSDTSYESYNKKAHSFYTSSKHITDLRC